MKKIILTHSTYEKVFFTADLHIGHKNILGFCSNTRKGTSVEEHDELLIEAWNSKVRKQDTVFILGDFSFADMDYTVKVLNRLPGIKFFIEGNHDKVVKNKPVYSQFELVRSYLRIVVDKIPVCLFHFPIWEWDMMRYGAYHFHGHVHGSLNKPGESPTIPGRIFDVGIDTRPNKDMSPWCWEELHEIMTKKEIRRPFSY